MRTTLNLPEGLLKEARALLQFRTNTETVIFALRELIRRRRIDDLKKLFGSVDLRMDVAPSRRLTRRVRVESRKRHRSARKGS